MRESRWPPSFTRALKRNLQGFFLLLVSDGRVLRGMVIRLMGFIWLISLRGYGLNSMGLICLMGLIEPISLMGLISLIVLG